MYTLGRISLAALCVLALSERAYSVDCNGNGFEDGEDIAAGRSVDANGNGVPDECERCPIIESFELTASDAAAADRFAFAAGLSGDVSIFGAPMEDSVDVDAGAAYVFRYADGAWTETVKLLAGDGNTFDHFGSAVAIEGDVAVIGSPDDDDRGSASGSVYVYRFDGSAWAQEAKLVAGDGAANDMFGTTLAVRGERIAVGVPRKDASGTDSGAVYVFRLIGGAWQQEARLVAADGSAADEFGQAVSLSDDLLLAGAPLDDGSGTNSGSAYAFRFVNGIWVQEAKLVAADAAGSDRFGRAVALTGDRVVISSPDDDDLGSNSGSIYVFRHVSGAWAVETKLRAYDGAAGDRLGDALAAEANIIVAGATGDDDGGSNAGAAYAFMLDGGGWVAKGKLAASDPAAGDGFGTAVCTSSGRVSAAVWQDDDAGFASGSACVFEGIGDCNASHLLDACDLAAGTSRDRNGNGTPDECDPDCNHNGVPDDLDLSAGTSRDCNGNGLLDECDLAAGTSRDCNANGAPDECDLAAGVSHDCNGNGGPDECDIAAGMSTDCDTNGVPDECEADSDGDGVIDGCDQCPGSPAGVVVDSVGCTYNAPRLPEEEVEICHVPPGQPRKRHTIRVVMSELAEHLAHGDSLGPCEERDDDRPTGHKPGDKRPDRHDEDERDRKDRDKGEPDEQDHGEDDGHSESDDSVPPIVVGAGSCGAGVPLAVMLTVLGLFTARSNAGIRRRPAKRTD